MEPDEVEQNSALPKAKKHDDGAADLERVTDYAEETEIAYEDMTSAIASFEGRRNKEKNEKAERERELAKVVIKKSDVDLIVQEMEIARAEAERSLRENQGDLVQSLIQLTN